jgi:hypothetical protein
MGVLPSYCFWCYVVAVGLKQIINNFSWETLSSLPPTELLSLVVLSALVLAIVLAVVGGIAVAFDR